MLDRIQKQEGFLQSVNPLLKLVSLITVVLTMLLFLDPWTPLLIYIMTFSVIVLLGKVPIKLVLLTTIPFFLFGLSFIWIYTVFPSERGQTILFTVLGMPIALENLMHGISLGLRSVVFGTWSLLFIFTTEPTALLLSMVQHAKLPPKFGYGLMVAYRLLPTFKEELEQLRLSYRLRGITEKKTLRGAVEQTRRYSIPLLASAIRKSTRTAIAMESKGFTGDRNRSYYRTIHWGKPDILYCVLLVTSAVLIFIVREHYFL
ncbi:energy-coupling factor transporter transmembrane protein EcfT [Marinilactibacillus sp. Marseille-P9653]|uniref:energy-coupling factor transporter transmembrane component T family protein n=1 Tax=Marinilactibacillus sp. Marseille-P9653 TaxID=2866583 RepID=UPI001CE46009|nr:energy-coupling factor transporter transmembrane component T [Marinilactibacillus sp. Marseille-P9653]